MKLARRCFLGAAVRDEGHGIEVLRVWPGSMAAQAGMTAGDTICAFGALDAPALASVDALVAACRARAGRASHLRFERSGDLHAREVPYVPFPDEEVPTAHVDYGETRGLRTMLVRPRTIEADTVVCFLPGIDYASVDYALRERAPAVHFLAGLVAAGIATYRIERPGLGDSPGLACAGFLDEQSVYRNGLETLRRSGQFDRIVLFGHSVGGMHAPMLADLADASIVYGTSARRWSTCLREGRDRQRSLRGQSPLSQMPPWPIQRPIRFHRELEAVDLAAEWSRAQIPSLTLIGAYDWVVSEREQRELPGVAAVLDGLDHAFTTHRSKQESLARLGRGSLDDQVATACARWLRELSGERR